MSRASLDVGGWWLLQGSVQGCGLRPAAAHYACTHRVGGWICNTEAGVLLHLRAPESVQQEMIEWLIDRFCGVAVPLASPMVSVVAGEELSHESGKRGSLMMFEIRDRAGFSRSERQWLTTVCQQLPVSSLPGPAVPRDRAICSDCLLEIRDPAHPRGGYVLNSCVHCGPRYSVLREMPWDRSGTVLATWALCSRCTAEYGEIEHRREHAQLISCPNCGPRLWLRQRRSISSTSMTEPNAVDFALQLAECPAGEAWLILQAVECLAAGGLIALQGIGGWQLVCDAGNSEAVIRLRSAKERPHKPLAVMIPSIDFLEAAPSLAEVALLQSPENPILICDHRLRTPIAPEVSGSLKSVGIFLPTTAMHDELLRRLQRPLVVSSANIEDDPILSEADAVQAQFTNDVDLLLGHQRPILRSIDDSVVRIIAGRTSVLRHGRGFAPLPLPLTVASEGPIVALGGHQKSSFAVAGNGRAVLGPHCGELNSEAARRRFLEQLTAVLELYQLTPAVLVHDMHPDYFTTTWARSQNLPTIAVQHHHAHAAAALLEARSDGPALTVAFDGTGYSPDGVIRGGEFLIASRTRCQPVASLLPFPLPAAELAARAPWRSAVAVLRLAIPEWDAETVAEWIANRPFARNDGLPPTAAMIAQLQHLSDEQVGPPCTSMGRLFDALACLILGTHTAGFEGAAAMQLEEQATAAFVASEDLQMLSAESLRALLPIRETSPLTVDWRPLVRAVRAATEQGSAVRFLSQLVHFSIAEGILDVSQRFPGLPVALTGGCFQNRLLTERTSEVLQGAGRECLLPGLIPVNDGGLAAGQLAVAAAMLQADRNGAVGQLPAQA